MYAGNDASGPKSIAPLERKDTVYKPYRSSVWHAAVWSQHSEIVPLCYAGSYWTQHYRDELSNDWAVTCGNCLRTKYWKEYLWPLIQSERQIETTEKFKEKFKGDMAKIASSYEPKEDEVVSGMTPDQLDLLSNFAGTLRRELRQLTEEGFSAPTSFILHHDSTENEIYITVSENGFAYIDFST